MIQPVKEWASLQDVSSRALPDGWTRTSTRRSCHSHAQPSLRRVLPAPRAPPRRVYAQLRKYLKQDQRWKEWENMDMQWIRHHNPDLVIFDDSNREVERIDLNGYSEKRLEALLEKKGFRRA